MPKLETLLEMLKADPGDAFVRYGVAMEYLRTKDYDKALAEFQELLRRNPDYVAAYFMGGRAYQQKGALPEARTMYQQGVAVAQKLGDKHAATEIGNALQLLEQVM